MKRLFFAMVLAIAVSAAAQTPTYTTPQSVTSSNFFSGVSTAQASSNFTNLGQTVHIVFYQGTGATGNPTGVQIRIEASFDGTTYFPISDDGTDPGQNSSNVILGVGAYPYVRANLVVCGSCSASNTITASYTGTSSIPGNVFGKYGAGQQIRKLAFLNQAASGSPVSPNFVTPYGSTAGFLVVSSSAIFTGGTLVARCLDIGSPTVSSFTLPATNGLSVPVAAQSCNLVSVRCSACSNGGGTYSVFWFFYPPGGALPSGAQPANALNSEATAAANTAVVTTLTVNAFQRGSVFSVSGRCSAGTAQLTVADGATTIYSTAATQVGTTNFDKTWNVGLASSPGNNLVITLGTCGVANTGTLDVQGSVF